MDDEQEQSPTVYAYESAMVELSPSLYTPQIASRPVFREWINGKVFLELY